MNRRLTIVAATIGEVEPLLDYLQANAEQHSFQTYQHHQILIDILYSGIGILETAYQLMDYTSHRHPDGWIQVGIGGAFDPALQMGSVYRIESELLVGFGAEDQDARILDPFKLGWSDPDKLPYAQGRLLCPYHPKTDLLVATGMTTFHAHGHQESIDRLKQ
ncbi:MAG TPA: hypothetical protein VJ508_15695, partial [Saprospiraceae bacterium]|nr:hypothetical protein [Saprospiraceae bacterium]